MKKGMIPALLAGMLVLTGCADTPDGVYLPEETMNFEETEAPTEIPTLSEEEISDLVASVTEAEKKPAQNANETPTVQIAGYPSDFGTAVYLGKTEDGEERIFFFYGDNNGSYLEQENGIGMGFTYELTDDGAVVFHIGDAESSEKAYVFWMDDAKAALDWESGVYETLKKLPYDPFAELHFYTNEVLRERALDLYEQKNGYRPTAADISSNYDGMLMIRLYDVMENDHEATSDWYTVDRFTGIGTNLMGETINLSDNPDAIPEPTTPTEPSATEEQPMMNW